jgi:Rrf2 family transcriptional regulator, nitric oxide-sensitive transcriptional repressor
MKFTKSAEQALRITTALAKSKQAITMTTLADQLNITYNNVVNVTRNLLKHNVLKTSQGKFGGISLNLTPELINIKTIVDLVDGPTRLANCFSDNVACDESSHCHIQQPLKNLQNKIDDLLSDITIASIIDENKQESSQA